MHKYFIVITCLLANKLIAQKVEPQIYFPNHISTALNERDFALSPNGLTCFYTIVHPLNSRSTIVTCTKTKVGWSQPEVASFSGEYSDLEPAFSPDGKKLFFCSNRPAPNKRTKDYDIWVMNDSVGGWSAPQRLNINTTEDEFYPSIANNGNLYFTAAYQFNTKKEDIYCSEYKNGVWQAPKPIDSNVCSNYYEFNACISPAEDFIIFTRDGHKPQLGKGDLYISNKINGVWQTSIALQVINSNRLDYCPSLSPDGKQLFFTSEKHKLDSQFVNQKINFAAIQKAKNYIYNGLGNIYTIPMQVILSYLPKQ
jgi:Tol biopolymer transport system component